jgi:dephospho-CoA kinase
MEIVGLTGGIASGKSTVAKMLRGAGIPVVDADQLARDAVAPGSDGLKAIVERFGEGYLDAGGGLDRAKLGALVFDDDEARRDLNRIVHPAVAQLAALKGAALAEAGEPVMVYEVPLLFENGLEAGMSCTILVAVDEETQLARLLARDDLDEAGARARVASQMSLAEKKTRATYVIDNAGDLAETARQLTRVWREITGVEVAFAA